jgi:hypothetical protein
MPVSTSYSIIFNLHAFYTIQYNTIQYNTIQYNTIQYNTIQYYTILYSLPHNMFTITNYVRYWNRKHTTYRCCCCCGALSEQSFDLISLRHIQSRLAILLTSNKSTLLHKLSLGDKNNNKSCVLQQHNHHY